MSAERLTSLQMNMFTGQLVDTRSQSQKQRDREASKPQQAEMFSAREVLQFGVNPHPLMPIAETTRLELQIQDLRSEEEKERDLQKLAGAQTCTMFSESIESSNNAEQQIECNEDEIFYNAMRLLNFAFPLF